jgi:hypothetical protein
MESLLQVASDSYSGQERKTRIVCLLQYWSECHAHYKPYVQFHLSESETCSLELPLPPNQVSSFFLLYVNK